MENYDAIINWSKYRKIHFYFNICNSFKIILYEFKAFTKEEMNKILYIALKDIDINIENCFRILDLLSSSGDARAMLTLLNFSYKVSKILM